MLNTGTSLISDVIGNDNQSSAFVYGCYSFMDKFSNGILLYVLVANYSADAHALSYVMSVIPLVTSFGSTVCTWAGIALYADKLAKISTGSALKKRNENITKFEQAKGPEEEKFLA